MAKESKKVKIIRSVALPRDLNTKLVAAARREDRSISYMIVRAVREMVGRGTENVRPKHS